MRRHVGLKKRRAQKGTWLKVDSGLFCATNHIKPPLLARTNLLNFKKDGKICNLPLYAVSLLPKYFLQSN